MATNLTRITQTDNRTTGHLTTTSETIAGRAMKTRGNPIRYRALGLIESEAPTLLWVPTTYNQGDEPQPGDLVTWNGLEYTVRDVDITAPDGEIIYAKIIIER